MQYRIEVIYFKADAGDAYHRGNCLILIILTCILLRLRPFLLRSFLLLNFMPADRNVFVWHFFAGPVSTTQLIFTCSNSPGVAALLPRPHPQTTGFYSRYLQRKNRSGPI